MMRMTIDNNDHDEDDEVVDDHNVVLKHVDNNRNETHQHQHH